MERPTLTINHRLIKAEQAASMVMHIIGKYITNAEDDYLFCAKQDLYEAFYEAGAEIVTNGSLPRETQRTLDRQVDR